MWIGYLFTDVEGSTSRWEKSPDRMDAAIARHDGIVDRIVSAHGGEILTRSGDGIFAVFRTGRLLECALALQLALQREDWSEVGGLAVRIGAHASLADQGAGHDDAAMDRVAINRAARIMSCGWGGQTIVSAQAVEAYDPPAGSTLKDLGVCRLRGVEEPQRLYGLIHPDLNKVDFPPLRSLALQNETIPVIATPLFGRDREVREIQTLLGEGGGLVTLMGPGGNGKTRLAAEIARVQSETGLVYFVELHGVASAAQLVTRIASMLRLPFHGRAPQEEQLFDYLRDRAALLILDNADAAIAFPAAIERLVTRCVRLCILATSRGALGVPGEVTYRVSGLALPQRADNDMAAAPAFQLFLQDARAFDPGFSIADDDAVVLREICRLVSGSPLALQLIAPWIRVLSLRDILARLQNSLQFLDEGPQHASRNRSLRSVFEGSWSLLTLELRRAMSAVAVFVGDFDAEAALVVAGVDASALARLETRGLVVQIGPRRFLLHPILREFAWEKATEEPERSQEARERHAGYFLDKIRSGVADVGSAQPGHTLDQLQTHVANVRAAWSFAIAAKKNDHIRETIEPLFYFLVMRSLYQEGAEIFGIPIEDPDLDCYRKSVLTHCHFHLGAIELAEALAREVRAAVPVHSLALAHAIHALAAAAHVRGHHESARRLYFEALDTRRLADDLIGCSYSITSLAALSLAQGRAAEARERIREAFRINRRIGHVAGMISVAVLGGDVAMQELRFADARKSYSEGLRLEEIAYNPQYRIWALLRLGVVEARLADDESAAWRLQEALDLAIDIGDRRMKSHALIDLGANLRRRGDFVTSKNRLLDAVRLSMAIDAEPLVQRALLELGRTDARLGGKERVRRIVDYLSATELGVLREDYTALLEEAGLPHPDVGDPGDLRSLVDGVLAEAEMEALGL